jgi:hypothetical protein
MKTLFGIAILSVHITSFAALVPINTIRNVNRVPTIIYPASKNAVIIEIKDGGIKLPKEATKAYKQGNNIVLK